MLGAIVVPQTYLRDNSMTTRTNILLFIVGLIAVQAGFLAGRFWQSRPAEPVRPLLPPLETTKLTEEQWEKALQNPDFKRVYEDVVKDQPKLSQPKLEWPAESEVSTDQPANE